LAEHPDRYFANQEDWNAHLAKLGIAALRVDPDPVLVATEGALWSSVTGQTSLFWPAGMSTAASNMYSCGGKTERHSFFPAWMTGKAGFATSVADPRPPVNRLIELRELVDRIMIGSSAGNPAAGGDHERGWVFNWICSKRPHRQSTYQSFCSARRWTSEGF
jgi:hypothetical protein